LTAFAGPHSVAARLEEAASQVRAALEVYLPRGRPAYHYELVADYPRRGGRMLRPALCLEVAQAFGAPAEAALPTAVALELLHNAFLVHDDIEDGSTQRRGAPTLHESHGVPVAINVGDALTLLSLRPLADNRALLGGARAFSILAEIERMGRETVEGQAMELDWRMRGTLDVSEAQYLESVLKKTCWYTTIFPCRAGAIIGGSAFPGPADFVRFGFFLGAAFQIQDDLLNLVGNPGRYGKELGGDVLEGKRTLPFIHLRTRLDVDERSELDRIYLSPRAAIVAEEVKWVVGLMEREGSIEASRGTAQGLAGAARTEFEHAFAGLPDSPHRQFVGDLVEWVISRA
jgi:geranylgeranyl diphosphate synthase type II